MSCRQVKCSHCAGQVTQNARGQILGHTRTEYQAGYKPVAVICEGSTPRARAT